MPAKRTLKPFDERLPQGQERAKKKQKREAEAARPKEVETVPTALFFAHNEQLGPPYYVLVDTNFLNMCVRNKIEPIEGMMNCLYAKCIPVVLDSVMAELEKLGVKYRVALRLARDERFVRMPGYIEKGTYADDDIVMMAKQHRCFIVATCDRELRRRLRKIPGVPIMYISQHKITVERMPEAFGAPR
jgi:U3 small nucleolar RNA-associated protein 24